MDYRQLGTSAPGVGHFWRTLLLLAGAAVFCFSLMAGQRHLAQVIVQDTQKGNTSVADTWAAAVTGRRGQVRTIRSNELGAEEQNKQSENEKKKTATTSAMNFMPRGGIEAVLTR
eukprot:g53232.t1